MIHRLLVSTPSNLSPVSEFDNGRICYRLPQTKLIAVYVSGGLFAIGWWAFIDALVYNQVNVTVGEVITGIITTLGMIIVALIDKSIFSGEFYIFPRRMLWRARLYLFFGFTLLVGGLIGSVFYFVYKYHINHFYTSDTEYYFGVAVVVQNGCILMSSLILLIGQYSNNEAKYDFL